MATSDECGSLCCGLRRIYVSFCLLRKQCNLGALRVWVRLTRTSRSKNVGHCRLNGLTSNKTAEWTFLWRETCILQMSEVQFLQQETGFWRLLFSFENNSELRLHSCWKYGKVKKNLCTKMCSEQFVVCNFRHLDSISQCKPRVFCQVESSCSWRREAQLELAC